MSLKIPKSGVFVDNTNLASQQFRARRGYATINKMFSEIGNANIFGSVDQKLPVKNSNKLIYGLRNGLPPGFDRNTEQWVVNSRKQLYRRREKSRTGYINPSVLTEPNSLGGDPYVLEMLLNGASAPLPFANNNVDQVNNNMLTELHRNNPNDPFTNAFASINYKPAELKDEYLRQILRNLHDAKKVHVNYDGLSNMIADMKSEMESKNADSLVGSDGDLKGGGNIGADDVNVDDDGGIEVLTNTKTQHNRNHNDVNVLSEEEEEEDDLNDNNVLKNDLENTNKGENKFVIARHGGENQQNKEDRNHTHGDDHDYDLRSKKSRIELLPLEEADLTPSKTSSTTTQKTSTKKNKIPSKILGTLNT